jgi:hypothetical protein
MYMYTSIYTIYLGRIYVCTVPTEISPCHHPCHGSSVCPPYMDNSTVNGHFPNFTCRTPYSAPTRWCTGSGYVSPPQKAAGSDVTKHDVKWHDMRWMMEERCFLRSFLYFPYYYLSIRHMYIYDIYTYLLIKRHIIYI